jgi:hypothetical protein
MSGLSRREGYVLILFAGLALIWGLIVNPFLQNSEWFINLNPVAAYILYNMGTYFLVTVIFGIPSAFVMKRKFEVKWSDILIGGLVAFLVFSNVFDMWQPPLAWSTNGTLLIPVASSSLENTAVDYMYGWIWKSLTLPVGLTYLFVYVLVPLATLLIAALSYGQKEFFILVKRL